VTLADLLVVDDPDAVLVHAGDRQVTGGALDAAASQVASTLTGLGAPPGAPVAVRPPPAASSVVCT
jgi:hypothetical protein